MRHEVPLVYFERRNCFRTIFGGFKLEKFDPRNVRKPIQFSPLFLTSKSRSFSNEYVK